MDTLVDFIKMFSLFFSILFVSVNLARAQAKEPIETGNFIWMSAGLTIFIYLQWLI